MAKKVKQVKSKVSSSNERPVGVTILAVLGYIGAVMTLLFALVFILGSAAISSAILAALPQLVAYSALGTTLFIVLGIILLACAVLNYYVARGLWNGRNWARILMLVLWGLNLVGSLWPFSLGSLVLSGLIIWYLGFYEPAVSYFK